MADVSVTAADLIVRRLRQYGVRHVFGYPGGQLTPLYDALYREPAIRHFLARHEQAAGFMADGYARATGQPGVCLAVCGPGVFNAATPLAAAHTDSVPVLLLSGQIRSAGRGLRTGYYHENDQLAVCTPITKERFRPFRVEDVVPLLDTAWATLTSGRPGPVLFEVPLDILQAETAIPLPPLPSPIPPKAPPAAKVGNLVRLIGSWQRPLILAGGGVVSAAAGPLLAQLAERLGAPVYHTAMGKGVFPASHPLAAGMPWFRATSDLTGMASFFSPLFAKADGLLALGCRFTQLATGSWTLPVPSSLGQIDIDPEEIGRHYDVRAGMVADLQSGLQALLEALPPGRREPWTAVPPRPEPWGLPGMDFVGPLRRALPPETILAADVTRLAYVLMTELPLERPRCFLHPAGSVAMGYALPAALGACAAWPGRPVVAIVGDGGFLMSGMELASAVQERLPVVVVLVNDNSLTLIRATQERRYSGRYIAVDLDNPDFGQFAAAFGVAYRRADGEEAFELALRESLAAGMPALIEVQPADTRPRGCGR
jgi:acetolactate synthase-1/2/3 large subunit